MLFSVKSVNDVTVLSLFGRKAPGKSQLSWLVRPHRAVAETMAQSRQEAGCQHSLGSRLEEQGRETSLKYRPASPIELGGAVPSLMSKQGWPPTSGQSQTGTLFSLAHFFMMRMMYSTWVLPVLLSRWSTSRRVSLRKRFERTKCFNRE